MTGFWLTRGSVPVAFALVLRLLTGEAPGVEAAEWAKKILTEDQLARWTEFCYGGSV